MPRKFGAIRYFPLWVNPPYMQDCVCSLQDLTSSSENHWDQRSDHSKGCSGHPSHLPAPPQPRILDRTWEVWSRQVLPSPCLSYLLSTHLHSFLPYLPQSHLPHPCCLSSLFPTFLPSSSLPPPFLRFTPEEKAKRPNVCHMPFGWGPHNCIGMRFALMEAKIALIEILRMYTFMQAPETEVSSPVIHFKLAMT